MDEDLHPINEEDDHSEIKNGMNCIIETIS